MGSPCSERTPPIVLTITYCGPVSASGRQPIPAFWVRPKMLPLGSVAQHLRGQRQTSIGTIAFDA